jgi:cysteine synthase A
MALASSRQPPHAVGSVLKTVGRTPLVRLVALERPGGPRLFAKCEFLGPGSSIFDRAAVAELVSTQRAGHLGDGRRLFAAGGTDAAISLAMATSAAGQPLTLLVPRSLLPQRRRILLDHGAALESLDDDTGFEAAQDLAYERAAAEHGLFVDLFDGELVTKSHGAIATELVEALGAPPALTLCGLDLGAIPTGLARVLGPGAVVAVEPEAARIGSGGPFGPHLMSGLAPGPDADALDRSLVRDFEAVSDADAWEAADELARATGILAGLASGAVLLAARRRAQALGPDATVVAVLPDAGDRRFWLEGFFP